MRTGQIVPLICLFSFLSIISITEIEGFQMLILQFHFTSSLLQVLEHFVMANLNFAFLGCPKRARFRDRPFRASIRAFGLLYKGEAPPHEFY